MGQSTGTTGTPTISIWTRRDLWIEYESSARVWWRYGHRPGMIVTHAHPAYLYGGGPMLSGSYEYFGMLNIWVPPPDTDELAEQGLRFWTRVKPDIPFMGFSTGRFFEVAAKVGIDPKDAGLEFKGMPGFGMGKGMPLMTAGRRVLRLRRRGLRRDARGPHQHGLRHRPGRRPRHRGRGGRRGVGRPGRHHPRP